MGELAEETRAVKSRSSKPKKAKKDAKPVVQPAPTASRNIDLDEVRRRAAAIAEARAAYVREREAAIQRAKLAQKRAWAALSQRARKLYPTLRQDPGLTSDETGRQRHLAAASDARVRAREDMRSRVARRLEDREQTAAGGQIGARSRLMREPLSQADATRFRTVQKLRTGKTSHEAVVKRIAAQQKASGGRYVDRVLLDATTKDAQRRAQLASRRFERWVVPALDAWDAFDKKPTEANRKRFLDAASVKNLNPLIDEFVKWYGDGATKTGVLERLLGSGGLVEGINKANDEYLGRALFRFNAPVSEQQLDRQRREIAAAMWDKIGERQRATADNRLIDRLERDPSLEDYADRLDEENRRRAVRDYRNIRERERRVMGVEGYERRGDQWVPKGGDEARPWEQISRGLKARGLNLDAYVDESGRVRGDTPVDVERNTRLLYQVGVESWMAQMEKLFPGQLLSRTPGAVVTTEEQDKLLRYATLRATVQRSVWNALTGQNSNPGAGYEMMNAPVLGEVFKGLGIGTGAVGTALRMPTSLLGRIKSLDFKLEELFAGRNPFATANEGLAPGQYMPILGPWLGVDLRQEAKVSENQAALDFLTNFERSKAAGDPIKALEQMIPYGNDAIAGTVGNTAFQMFADPTIAFSFMKLLRAGRAATWGAGSLRAALSSPGDWASAYSRMVVPEFRLPLLRRLSGAPGLLDSTEVNRGLSGMFGRRITNAADLTEEEAAKLEQMLAGMLKKPSGSLDELAENIFGKDAADVPTRHLLGFIAGIARNEASPLNLRLVAAQRIARLAQDIDRAQRIAGAETALSLGRVSRINRDRALADAYNALRASKEDGAPLPKTAVVDDSARVTLEHRHLDRTGLDRRNASAPSSHDVGAIPDATVRDGKAYVARDGGRAEVHWRSAPSVKPAKLLDRGRARGSAYYASRVEERVAQLRAGQRPVVETISEGLRQARGVRRTGGRGRRAGGPERAALPDIHLGAVDRSERAALPELSRIQVRALDMENDALLEAYRQVFGGNLQEVPVVVRKPARPQPVEPKVEAPKTEAPTGRSADAWVDKQLSTLAGAGGRRANPGEYDTGNIPVVVVPDDHWVLDSAMGNVHAKAMYSEGGIIVSERIKPDDRTLSHELGHAYLEAEVNAAAKREAESLVTNDFMRELIDRAMLGDDRRMFPHEFVAELFGRWRLGDKIRRRPAGNPKAAGATKHRIPANFEDLRSGVVLEDGTPLSAESREILTRLASIFERVDQSGSWFHSPDPVARAASARAVADEFARSPRVSDLKPPPAGKVRVFRGGASRNLYGDSSEGFFGRGSYWTYDHGYASDFSSGGGYVSSALIDEDKILNLSRFDDYDSIGEQMAEYPRAGDDVVRALLAELGVGEDIKPSDLLALSMEEPDRFEAAMRKIGKGAISYDTEGWARVGPMGESGVLIKDLSLVTPEHRFVHPDRRPVPTRNPFAGTPDEAAFDEEIARAARDYDKLPDLPTWVQDDLAAAPAPPPPPAPKLAQVLRTLTRDVKFGSVTDRVEDPIAADLLRRDLASVQHELDAMGVTDLAPLDAGASSVVLAGKLDGADVVVRLTPGRSEYRQIVGLVRPIRQEVGRDLSWAVLPRLDTTGITASDVRHLKDMAFYSGWAWGDDAIDNVGRGADGRVYILDPSGFSKVHRIQSREADIWEMGEENWKSRSRSLYETGPANGFQVQRGWRRDSSDDRALLAFDENGKLVGFVYWLSRSGDTLDGRPYVMVRPDARRKGWATKLYEEGLRRGLDFAEEPPVFYASEAGLAFRASIDAARAKKDLLHPGYLTGPERRARGLDMAEALRRQFEDAPAASELPPPKPGFMRVFRGSGSPTHRADTTLKGSGAEAYGAGSYWAVDPEYSAGFAEVHGGYVSSALVRTSKVLDISALERGDQIVADALDQAIREGRLTAAGRAQIEDFLARMNFPPEIKDVNALWGEIARRGGKADYDSGLRGVDEVASVLDDMGLVGIHYHNINDEHGVLIKDRMALRHDRRFVRVEGRQLGTPEFIQSKIAREERVRDAAATAHPDGGPIKGEFPEGARSRPLPGTPESRLAVKASRIRRMAVLQQGYADRAKAAVDKLQASTDIVERQALYKEAVEAYEAYKAMRTVYEDVEQFEQPRVLDANGKPKMVSENGLLVPEKKVVVRREVEISPVRNAIAVYENLENQLIGGRPLEVLARDLTIADKIAARRALDAAIQRGDPAEIARFQAAFDAVVAAGQRRESAAKVADRVADAHMDALKDAIAGRQLAVKVGSEAEIDEEMGADLYSLTYHARNRKDGSIQPYDTKAVDKAFGGEDGELVRRGLKNVRRTAGSKTFNADRVSPHVATMFRDELDLLHGRNGLAVLEVVTMVWRAKPDHYQPLLDDVWAQLRRTGSKWTSKRVGYLMALAREEQMIKAAGMAYEHYDELDELVRKRIHQLGGRARRGRIGLRRPRKGSDGKPLRASTVRDVEILEMLAKWDVFNDFDWRMANHVNKGIAADISRAKYSIRMYDEASQVFKNVKLKRQQTRRLFHESRAAENFDEAWAQGMDGVLEHHARALVHKFMMVNPHLTEEEAWALLSIEQLEKDLAPYTFRALTPYQYLSLNNALKKLMQLPPNQGVSEEAYRRFFFGRYTVPEGAIDLGEKEQSVIPEIRGLPYWVLPGGEGADQYGGLHSWTGGEIRENRVVVVFHEMTHGLMKDPRVRGRAVGFVRAFARAVDPDSNEYRALETMVNWHRDYYAQAGYEGERMFEALAEEFMAELYALWRIAKDAPQYAGHGRTISNVDDLETIKTFEDLYYMVAGGADDIASGTTTRANAEALKVLGQIDQWFDSYLSKRAPDPAIYGLGGHRRPPVERADLFRQWMKETGRWSPRTAELIRSGQRAWSLDEEIEYLKAHGYELAERHDEAMVGRILADPELRQAKLIEWGYFDDEFETEGRVIPDGEEGRRAIAYGTDGLVKGRTFEENRRWLVERYGTRVGRPGQGPGGVVLTSAPDAMTLEEFLRYAGEIGRKNLPGGLLDPKAGKALERAINAAVRKRLRAWVKDGLLENGADWLPEEQYLFSLQIANELMAYGDWLGLFPKASRRRRFIMTLGWVLRANIATQLAFPVMNLIDRYSVKPFLIALTHGYNKIVPVDLDEDARRIGLRSVGRSPGGVFEMRTEGALRIALDRSIPGGARRRALLAFAKDWGYEVSSWGEDSLRTNFLRGVYKDQRDFLISQGVDVDRARLVAKYGAQRKLDRMFPALENASDLEKLFNELVPFFSYNARNKILGLKIFLDRPYLWLLADRFGRAIEAGNRESWEKEHPGVPFDERTARIFHVVIDGETFAVDLSSFSDWFRGPVDVFVKGAASPQEFLGKFLRVPHPQQAALVNFLLNSIDDGTRETPWGAPADLYSVFWPADLMRDLAAMVEAGDTVAVVEFASKWAFYQRWKHVSATDARVSLFFSLLNSGKRDAARRYAEGHPDVAEWLEAHRREGFRPDLDGFSTSWFNWHSDADGDQLIEDRAQLRRITAFYDKELARYAFEPWNPEASRLRKERRLAILRFENDHPALMTSRLYRFSARDWSEQLGEWAVDDMTDAYFKLLDQKPKKADFEDEKAYYEAVLRWQDVRAAFLEANPAVVARLRTETDAVRQAWFDQQVQWEVIAKRQARLSLAIIEAESAKEPDKEVVSALYRLRAQGYRQLDKEAWIDVDVSLPGGGLWKSNRKVLGQYMNVPVKIPGSAEYFYDMASPEEQAKIRADEKFYQAMDEVWRKSDKGNGETDWTLWRKLIGKVPGLEAEYMRRNPSAMRGSTYFKLITALYNRAGRERFYLELSKDPALMAEYFRRHPEKLERFKRWEAGVRYYNKLQEVLQGASTVREFWDALEKDPWLLSQYLGRNPDRAAGYAAAKRYFNSIKHWSELLETGDLIGAWNYWRKLPPEVRERFGRMPGRAEMLTNMAYGAAMAGWANLFKAGKYKEADAYFDRLPQWVKDRYFAKHPDRAAQAADARTLADAVDYFLLGSAAEREAYLRKHPSLASWFSRYGGNEEARRGLIMAAYRQIPKGNSWLKRVFRERYPEIFSEEAAEAAWQRTLERRLKEHPELADEFAAWVERIWASYAEALKHEKPVLPVRRDRLSAAITRRNRRGRSAEWTSLRSRP